MSKFVKVKTELRDLRMIKQSLEDLKLDYSENAMWKHFFSGFSGKVDLVVKTPAVSFGLRKNEQELYEVLADDMQVKSIKVTLQKVQQRYAYHKVVEETAKAGFELVEEKVGADKVIRLTVRRWN
jgi:hypothetical protein